jgi:hypothetical protein
MPPILFDRYSFDNGNISVVFQHTRDSQGWHYEVRYTTGAVIASALNMGMPFNKWVGLMVLDMLNLETLNTDHVLVKADQ